MNPLVAAVLAGSVPDFALLYRPQSGPAGRVEVLAGDARRLDSLAHLPDLGRVLALVPYRQLAERGYACHDDGAPLLAMTVRDHDTVGVDEVIAAFPDESPAVQGGVFEPDDAGYARIVRDVVANEIGRGAGANFVLRRSFLATIPRYSVRAALAVFRRLLQLEQGAYWTFVVRCGQTTLVGASPERQVSVDGATAAMTPISGTYRYPPGGPSVADVRRFLADRKESEELHMVVDEELKMMSRVCAEGGRLAGPFLRPMARLAHTEYTIEGSTDLDLRQVLRETMFAPTVTGSPLRNACRVIARHERRGRGYYGGVLALLDRRDGRRSLDSVILIRTAAITPDGRLEIGVGATLVHRSDPRAEADETRAKAATLLDAFRATPRPVGPTPGCAAATAADARVGRALAARNAGLSRFWLTAPQPVPANGVRVLVVDAEDAFATMLAHQLRALGATVDVRPVQVASWPSAYDVVVIGPGPGDPRDVRDERIGALHELTRRLLADRVPLLAICLGHQILATLLGLPVRRDATPTQGVQREIDFFGRRERVGFYNTFSATSTVELLDGPGAGVKIEVSRDPDTGRVHGLRGPAIRSVQFHPESVLTEHGSEILDAMLHELIHLVPDAMVCDRATQRSV